MVRSPRQFHAHDARSLRFTVTLLAYSSRSKVSRKVLVDELQPDTSAIFGSGDGTGLAGNERLYSTGVSMTFKDKSGLFSMWLVLTLLWVLATAWTGLGWDWVVGVPGAFGVALYLVVGAIRGFAAKESPRKPSI